MQTGEQIWRSVGRKGGGGIHSHSSPLMPRSIIERIKVRPRTLDLLDGIQKQKPHVAPRGHSQYTSSRPDQVPHQPPYFS